MLVRTEVGATLDNQTAGVGILQYAHRLTVYLVVAGSRHGFVPPQSAFCNHTRQVVRSVTVPSPLSHHLVPFSVPPEQSHPPCRSPVCGPQFPPVPRPQNVLPAPTLDGAAAFVSSGTGALSITSFRLCPVPAVGPAEGPLNLRPGSPMLQCPDGYICPPDCTCRSLQREHPVNQGFPQTQSSRQDSKTKPSHKN